jgi:hypothetical protein
MEFVSVSAGISGAEGHKKGVKTRRGPGLLRTAFTVHFASKSFPFESCIPLTGKEELFPIVARVLQDNR